VDDRGVCWPFHSCRFGYLGMMMRFRRCFHKKVRLNLDRNEDVGQIG
jgi:hypothetical protein